MVRAHDLVNNKKMPKKQPVVGRGEGSSNDNVKKVLLSAKLIDVARFLRLTFSSKSSNFVAFTKLAAYEIVF